MPSLDKIFFVLSLLAFTFAYGYASHAWEWFPHSYIQRAWPQVKSVFRSDLAKTEPQVYPRSGTRLLHPQKTQPGLTLITSYWKSEDSDKPVPGARLIDHKGNTVHQWLPNRFEIFQNAEMRRDLEKTNFDGSYLFSNGDILLVLEYTGAVRLNSCGKVLWKINKGNHHYLSRNNDGSFWIPGTSPRKRESTDEFPTGYPGIEKPVWIDYVFHVSEDGDIIDKIDVLGLLYKNNLERHIVKSLSPKAKEVHPDVIHINDVESLSTAMAAEYPLFEAGDLLVSLREPSLVLVFDPQTEKVKWHSSHPFLHQHDPDFSGNGWIGVFDNNYDLTTRGTMLGGSRIVATQPHTDSLRVRFPTSKSDTIYTRFHGQWQQLQNGNMLLVESMAGRIMEVAPDGRTVWEWIQKPHKKSRILPVTGAHRYNLTRKQVSSWPCSSFDSTSASIQ